MTIGRANTSVVCVWSRKYSVGRFTVKSAAPVWAASFQKLMTLPLMERYLIASVAPPLEDSAELTAKKAHVAFAGLPDGVAIVGAGKNADGSYVLGQDTHIIHDDASTAVTFERTSSYHRAFDPLATYYDGKLYVAAQNATEADAMYFRSTKYELKADEPTPQPEPSPVVTGGKVGKSYKVAGNTYKVTSNKKNTVTFTKAKNAKIVTVPSTVKINGKTYKVTAIGEAAFASAKKKLETVVMGKNVTSIGKAALKGCAKLKKVTGGASVKTVSAQTFAGCKAMAKCAPLSSKKLAKVGPSALKGAKKLKTLTVKSKLLKKKAVKGSLKGSSVKTVKVKVGKAKANKACAKKYAKCFTKANCGKKVIVKA